MEKNFELVFECLAKIENMAALAAKTTLSMDDAALLTGLSKSTLYKMVCQKKIPYYKSQSEKLIYFEKESLNNWMLNVRVDTEVEVERGDMPNIQVFVNRKEEGNCLSLILQGLLFCLKLLYLCAR